MSSRPGSSITCARQMQPRGRAGPGWPAGDLPAHRLVGQLAHAVKLLLHRGPAAALARELGEERSCPEPAAGLHGSRAQPPGRRRRHCGAWGAAWPAPSLPRAPPPIPPTASFSVTRPGPPSASAGPPGLQLQAPARRANRGVSAGWLGWLAGRVVPMRLCGMRRACWDL